MPTTAGEEKAMLALQEKLDRMMAKGKPTKREEALKSFRYVYPRLESYFASGKPMKEVLTAFNEVTQSKMCARTFKELLDQERMRRDQDGNSICCESCGHVLKTPLLADTDIATPKEHAGEPMAEETDAKP